MHWRLIFFTHTAVSHRISRSVNVRASARAKHSFSPTFKAAVNVSVGNKASVKVQNLQHSLLFCFWMPDIGLKGKVEEVII